MSETQWTAICAAVGIMLGTGAPAWADGPTERVSIGPDGVEANYVSGFPALSRDGRFVVFHSGATNLAPHANNGVDDVFVRDRKTGVTTLLSVGLGGIEADEQSQHPVISGGGRFVAFQSDATNLVAGDNDFLSDVFVHDRRTHTIELVSVDPTGASGGGGQPSISADGRFVAFTSGRPLVAGDSNLNGDVYVRDRKLGKMARVSVSSSGTQGNGSSGGAAISGNGRYVAFQSGATNLVPGDTTSGENQDLFVHDRKTRKTTRVSVGIHGTEANDTSFAPSFSADGRFVAFTSAASNLILNDTNNTSDVFVYDQTAQKMERVSIASGGGQSNGGSSQPAISADGRFVAFTSFANNLVPNDTNGDSDIFIFDRLTHQTRLVSIGKNGGAARDTSDRPAISADGRAVAFDSLAKNLVSGDTNRWPDVFLRPLGAP